MPAPMLPLVIKSARVFTNGDASVGLSGWAAEIRPEGDCLMDLEPLPEAERAEAVDRFRLSLASAFAAAWDDEWPTVVFDFEQYQD